MPCRGGYILSVYELAYTPMNISFKTHNLDLTDDVRTYAEDKAGAVRKVLGHHAEEDIACEILLSRDDKHASGLIYRADISALAGGEKVHAEEVEAVLLRHDDVFDAAVVGTPHERWGQQVTAVVQLRKGSSATQADLREHAKSLISNYKVPKAFLLVGEVPRTSVGKIDYPASLELASSLLAGPGG